MMSDIILVPFEIIYCVFFIYQYLGWSVLSGLALVLVRILLLYFMKDDKIEYHNKMKELGD